MNSDGFSLYIKKCKDQLTLANLCNNIKNFKLIVIPEQEIVRLNGMKIVQWVYEQRIGNIDWFHVLRYNCSAGNLDVVKWLCSKLSFEGGSIRNGYFIPDDCPIEILDMLENDTVLGCECVWKIVRKYCMLGNIEKLKKYWELYNLKWIAGEIFSIACKYGHLDIAQWIYRTVNIINDRGMQREPGDPVDIMRCFRDACEHGHVKIVKWLYELSISDKTVGTIHIHRNHFNLYKKCIKYKKVIKFLSDIGMLGSIITVVERK
jgi:hypothetical protein